MDLLLFRPFHLSKPAPASRWGWAGLVVTGLLAGCGSFLDLDGYDYVDGAGGAGASAVGGGGATGGAGATSASGGQGGAGANGSGGATGGNGGGAGEGGGPGGTGGEGGEGTGFYDDFDRADDPGIGNGWVEKSPDTFALLGDHIVKQQAGPGYKDNLVYRPASEAILDVEASIEVEFTTASIERPQLLVRAQLATIDTPNGYDGYKLWIPGTADQAIVARQHGTGGSTGLQTFNLSPGLVQGERYRLRLAAVGTTTVTLTGTVEQWTGSAWNVIGSTTLSDSDAVRVETAGTVGFSGGGATTYVFDNFRYDAL